MSFWFGDFELDQERRQLLRVGRACPPRAEGLRAAEPAPGAPAAGPLPGPDPRRDLAGTYVSESTLAVVVNAIRQALGDDARHPRFIRTVHGFGYAFCGEARESTADAREPEQAHAAEALGATRAGSSRAGRVRRVGHRTPGTASGRRWRVAAVATGVLVLLGAGWLAIRWTKSSSRPLQRSRPEGRAPHESSRGRAPSRAVARRNACGLRLGRPKRDNFDVYVKDIASGDMVRVTQDPAPDYRPVWSPDGKHLAFLRARETGAAVFVPAVGGQEQRLVDIVEPAALVGSGVVVGPLVAGRPLPRRRRPCVRWSELGHRPRLGRNGREANAHREHGVRASSTAFPTFSPDGRRLAFLRGRLSRWSRDLLVQPLSRGTPAAPSAGRRRRREGGARRHRRDRSGCRAAASWWSAIGASPSTGRRRCRSASPAGSRRIRWTR